jgi:LEA14-like dessication related protein
MILALLAQCAFACAGLKDLLGGEFKKPSLNFKRVDFSDFSLCGLTLNTVWALDNPNPVAIRLAELGYNLSVENKQVVAGSPAKGLDIGSNQVSELVFPANIKFLDVASVLSTFLTKDRANYKASGEIGVDTPVGVMRFPLSHEGDFEVPKTPSIDFGSPRISDMSIRGATIELPLSIGNRNSFALPISGIAGGLSLAGVSMGTLSTGDLGALDAKGSKNISLPLKVNFFEAGGAVMKAVQDGKTELAWNADVKSGAGSAPISIKQFVDIIR